MIFRQRISKFLGLAVFGVAGVALYGCSNEREVLDVDTPNGSLEVNENTDTGEVEIDVDDN